MFSRGKLLSQKDSLNHYRQAIKLCPGYTIAYDRAGNILRKKGEHKKAITLFKNAAHLGSSNYKLYYLLANLLFTEGYINEASVYLKTSLSINKTYPKALFLNEKIKNQSDKKGPNILLLEPELKEGKKYSYDRQYITIRGIVTDKSGVSKLEVNGKTVIIDTKDIFLENIILKKGQNSISIIAEDLLGNHSTIFVNIDYIKKNRPVRHYKASSNYYSKSYAVIIGINNYDNWPPLEFAVSDAQSVKIIFQQLGFDEVILIKDHEATQRRLLTILGHELPKKLKQNDQLVIYFAGHGQTEDLINDEKKGYIIPVDADIENYFATAISMETLRSLSARIPAKHILYVMDSCYSGLGLSRSLGIRPKGKNYLEKMTSMRAIQIITAGGKDEEVVEKDGHGLFTTFFLKGLKGQADVNKDNVITASELGAYIRPKVIEESNSRQSPLYGRLEGLGDMIFLKQ